MAAEDTYDVSAMALLMETKDITALPFTKMPAPQAPGAPIAPCDDSKWWLVR